MDIQESSRKDNEKFNLLDFPGVIWKSKRSCPGERIFRLSESLKSRILAALVPPPGCTGFITKLLFWATSRLKLMSPFPKGNGSRTSLFLLMNLKSAFYIKYKGLCKLLDSCQTQFVKCWLLRSRLTQAKTFYKWSVLLALTVLQ